MTEPARSTRLLLLRHGEVSSHRGDVAVTSAGLETAREVARGLARAGTGAVTLLTGETRRARQTAEAIGSEMRAMGVSVSGPRVAFALRNPDLYLAGERVDMVSSAEALASQVEGVRPEDVEHLAFYPEFIGHADRIGWWLRHESPPGETAVAVSDRVHHFARSLADVPTLTDTLTIAVTHSPLVRAVGLVALGEDIGEPAWVSGLDLAISPDLTISVARFPRS